MSLLHRVWLCLMAALLVTSPVAAQTFPKLTGPVVDQADIIPADVEARLAQKLTALKTQSQRELVVVTLPDLQGYDISDYGYRLGRHWQLGDKARDDGAMLIVAPNERKVRIEVGYGLEPIVTDGLSSLIINREVVPRFKAGDMPAGIEAGVDALITQLRLPPEEAQKVAAQAQTRKQTATDGDGIPIGTIIWLAIFFLFFVLPLLRRMTGGRRYGRSSGVGQIILWEALNAAARSASSNNDSWGGGGGFGGGGGGGSWGGGGGSFGGGGASGSW